MRPVFYMSDMDRKENMGPEAEAPVITLETTEPKAEKPFTPQAPVTFYGGNPAKLLSPREKALLLKIFNRTRSGEKVYTVEVLYQRQTNVAPRIEGADYQIPSGVSPQTHMGQVIKAQFSQDGNWFMTLADTLRQNQGESGYTSVRLAGLKSLKVLAEKDGPTAPTRRSPSDLIDII